MVASRLLYVFICAKSVSFVLTGLRQVWSAAPEQG
jgi:hypothetical protein